MKEQSLFIEINEIFLRHFPYINKNEKMVILEEIMDCYGKRIERSAADYYNSKRKINELEEINNKYRKVIQQIIKVLENNNFIREMEHDYE